MKKTLMMAAVACAALVASCTTKNGSITMGDKSQLDSLSYAFGTELGFNLTRMMYDIPFDYDEMMKGVKEGAMERSRMTPEEARELVGDYFRTERTPRSEKIEKEYALTPDSLRGEIDRSSMFKDEQERRDISYGFGVDMGDNMLKSGYPIQLYWFDTAIRDVVAEKAQMTQIDARRYLLHYMQVVIPEQNKKECEEWLRSIEKQPGVQKTESGLLYRIEEPGDENVKAGDSRDVVEVHYTGWNHKGQVFDSSRFESKPEEVQEMMKQMDPEGYAKDEPVKFPLNRVIAGWGEGLKLVGKGGKITLWIPSDLAYGPRGMMGNMYIRGNEALKFEVELIGVEPFVEEQAEEVAVEE